MRELHEHKVNPANERLQVIAEDGPGPGGASHRYRITGAALHNNPSHTLGDPVEQTVILFQNGGIAEVGVNGVTHESLLAIVADRLRAFQAGAYACEENASALLLIEGAQAALKARTQKRVERGVEGTLKV